MLVFEYLKSPSYDIYDRLIHGDATTDQVGMLDGEFYVKKGLIIPFSYNPTTFSLSTDDLSNPISIQISRLDKTNIGVDRNKQARIYMLAPINQTISTTYTTNVRLQLGKGKNEIIIKQGNYTTSLIVTTTYYATIMQGYADDLYNYSIIDYDRQLSAIQSPKATRLAEPFLSISDMLPNVQTLQLLASKMIIRQYMSEQGRQEGVTDFLAGLVQNTPLFKQQKNLIGLNPIIQPIFRNQEDFSGLETHVWIPNLAIASWQAYLKFVSNIKTVYSLEKVTESEIVVKVDDSLISHQFDFGSDSASLFNVEMERSCYDNMRAYATLSSHMVFTMCAAGYPFDFLVTNKNPLFNFNLDYADFIGLSLTGRLDGGFYFDTMVVKEIAGSCAYPNGYYTQVPTLNEIPLEASPTIATTGNVTYWIYGHGFGLGSFGSEYFGR